MRVLITGGAGFLGQKLAKRLAADGAIAGRPINELVLADAREPVAPEGHGAVVSRSVDVTDSAQVEELFSRPFDAVYHLAAVVSGQAEEDFDLGMKVNLLGTLNVFEAARDALRPAGGGLRLLGRGAWRRGAGGGAGRGGAESADLLRNAEGDGRASAQRHDPARLHGRARPAAAHRLDPAGPGERRGLGLHVLDLPRAASGRAPANCRSGRTTPSGIRRRAR